jgi:PTH1 family peptidyl-tRNA hydrolase
MSAGSKFLIVGLGNPGLEYQQTRHNIGFMAVEALAGPEVAFKPGRHADVAEVKHRGRTLVLLKPTTFMNLSGKAVQHHLAQWGIPPSQLLVITDDLALPFGTLRLRGQGSSGGHNGLKHIEATLGNGNWARLRMGIGDRYLKGQQVDFVLGKFHPEQEAPLLAGVLQAAADCARYFAFVGLPQTMTQFNKNWLPNPPATE